MMFYTKTFERSYKRFWSPLLSSKKRVIALIFHTCFLCYHVHNFKFHLFIASLSHSDSFFSLQIANIIFAFPDAYIFCTQSISTKSFVNIFNFKKQSPSDILAVFCSTQWSETPWAIFALPILLKSLYFKWCFRFVDTKLSEVHMI